MPQRTTSESIPDSYSETLVGSSFESGASEPRPLPADRQEQNHDDSGGPLTGERSTVVLESDDRQAQRIETLSSTGKATEATLPNNSDKALVEGIAGGREHSQTPTRRSEHSETGDGEPERVRSSSETQEEVGIGARAGETRPKAPEHHSEDCETGDGGAERVGSLSPPSETQQKPGNGAQAGHERRKTPERHSKDPETGDGGAEGVRELAPSSETQGEAESSAQAEDEPPPVPVTHHADTEGEDDEPEGVRELASSSETQGEVESSAQAGDEAPLEHLPYLVYSEGEYEEPERVESLSPPGKTQTKHGKEPEKPHKGLVSSKCVVGRDSKTGRLSLVRAATGLYSSATPRKAGNGAQAGQERPKPSERSSKDSAAETPPKDVFGDWVEPNHKSGCSVEVRKSLFPSHKHKYVYQSKRRG